MINRPVSLIFSTFLIALTLVGCAHQPQKITLTEEELARVNKEALELASKRLETLVEDAKKQGSASSQYLATSLFLKGNSALLEGDFITGVVLFRHLISLTDDIFVHKKYAVALIRIGEMEEARHVLQKVYESDKGKDETVGLILAGVYAGLEKSDEARKIYRQILAANPKQEEACLFLGKSLALDKKWEEAQSQLTACQKRHQKNGIFSYYLGKMLVDRGDIKGALRAFEASYRYDSSSTQTTAALGVVYEQLEQTDKAIKVYQAHVKERPHDVAILSRLVQALFVKERFEEVIPFAERLVDLDPEDLNMRVKLGILYTDAKDYDKAVSVFRELLELAPESDKILYYLGAIHQELQKFETAIDYFARIPTESGLYQDSSYQMANMLGALAQVEHEELGKSGEVGARFVKLVDAKLKEIPDLKVELSVLKAGFFEAVESDHEAVAALEIVKAEKNFGSQHQYYLAGLLEKVKRYDASTAIIMAMLDKDPKNAHAWNFIGYSMLERGSSPEEALPYIQKALQISPEDGYIRDSLGWYYFKKGKLKEALKELSFAFKKIPDDVVIAKHLALIHKDMKNFKQAREYLGHALKSARLASEKREIAGVIENLDRLPASVESAANKD